MSTPPELKGISKKQRTAERRRVKAWLVEGDKLVAAGELPRPLADLIGIPPDRIRHYVTALREKIPYPEMSEDLVKHMDENDL